MFFYLINNSELKEKAYEYIFSLCDSVAYLYTCYNNNSNFECDIIGTDYAKIKRSIIKSKTGESWGMRGTIYTFHLSNDIKKVINNLTLNRAIRLTDTSCLENLELYKNGKCLYSICSHEGYEEIDDEFLSRVSSFCLKEIEHTNLYQRVLDKFSNVLSYPLTQISRDLKILKSLDAYVQEDWQNVIRIAPEINCSYPQYLEIAHKYLSDGIVSQFAKFLSFKELYPTGYPRTFEEIMSFKNNPPFQSNELYKQIMEELDMYNVAIFKTFGVGDIFHYGNQEEQSPTIIVNEKIKK